ncbi:MAG: endonuclease MutS2 [Paludibacteraceae bacterium]
MIYPLDFEHRTDFAAVRSLLSDYCTFPIGKEHADALTFVSDYNLVVKLLDQTREMLSVLSDASLDFPQCEMHDMRESLSRIRIDGLFLEEQELFRLRKALDAVVQYAHFFASLDAERFPVLSTLTDSETGVSSLSPLLTAIDRILDKYGQLRDNASPQLAEIRHELQKAQGSVSRALNSILHKAQADGLIDKDVTPTLREGRLVIPVPPMYKRKFGGIVHDESATGKTVYVEPQQVVEANNRIRELEGDERRERARILTAFASYCRPYLPVILQSQSFLGKVDFLRAKALLGRELGAIAPIVENRPMLRWREARHPLLMLTFRRSGKQVVPLDIALDEHSRILVISGPNAGGKSVCLKTVALLQYMMQCGLLVPMREDSVMGFFRDIFIDIGDQQSIEDDLSTYSSHLRNMKYFVRNSGAESLLLIDEFGGGTEPQIGGAIAESVLTKLNDNGSYGVITTHYSNLKHFAEDTDGVVNGAMLYDRGQLRPLFQLSIGQPGSSFAIEIARQIGLPEDIIAQTVALVGEEHIDYDKHLQDIARDKRYWENKRQQIRQKEKRLEERLAYYEDEIAHLKEKKREMLAAAQREAAELLEGSNAIIENTIRTIKEAAADKERTKQARQQLEQFKSKVNQPSADTAVGVWASPPAKTGKKHRSAKSAATPQEKPAVTVGCKVRIRGKNMIGEVLELTDKKALVAFGNLQSQVSPKELEYVSARQAKKGIAVNTQPLSVSNEMRRRKLNFSKELDLRGKRADEALTEVMNYIDDAVMVGAEEVRILHGTGTGALRQVVRGYLQNVAKVQSFHDAHPDNGGAGITVVEL